MPLGKTSPRQIKVKKSVKPIYIRAPQGFHDDLQEIAKLSGLSMNAVCLELLRPAIKQKLKELHEEK